jgi:hypothetical protein
MSKKESITTLNLVTGKVYMARRLYNSKRMVMEPFKLLNIRYNNESTNPFRHGYWRDGVWAMDGATTTLAPRDGIYEFDPRWVKRKVEDLTTEQLHLAKKINNLLSL